MADEEFKRQTYTHLEKLDKITNKLSEGQTKLVAKVDSHIEIAKLVETQDAKNLSKMEKSLEKIAESDYVTTSQLTTALDPIKQTLKSSVSLKSLIAVVSACTAVITLVIILMTYLNPVAQ